MSFDKGRPIPDATDQTTMAGALSMMAELLKEIRSSTLSDRDKDARLDEARLALEQQRLSLETDRASREMPENKVFNGKTHFNPSGGMRPKLTVPTFWVGFDEREELLTNDEIAALNLLKPGEYQVTKADGQRIPFKVTAKYLDAIDEATNRPKVEALSVWFPCKGDARQNHLSKTSYCRQAMTGAIPTHSDLLVEIERLKSELAKVSVLSAV